MKSPSVYVQLAEGRLRIEALETENRKLRAALEAVEWVARGTRVSHRICPWCNSFMHQAHKPDCQRQAALTPAEPPSKGGAGE